MNRSILGNFRSLTKHAGISHQYWGEALLHDVCMSKRTSTVVLTMSTPHERLFGCALKSANMRLFDCAAYARRYETQRSNKFDSRVEMGVYVGIRGYMHRSYYLDKWKLVLSKHGAIDED